MKAIRRITFLSLLLVLFAVYLHRCVAVNVVDGTLNEEFNDQLTSLDSKSTVVIRSNGGYASDGARVLETILEKDLSVVIDDNCFSACAEYILLSPKLQFENSPIVGFHGNPILHQHVLDLYRTIPPDQCYNSGAKTLKNFYREAGANSDFWKEQANRLIIIPPKKWRFDGCPLYKYEFQHKYWFPTSEQLRSLMGIEFTGTVCADDPECVENKLMEKWKKGTTFVVGDKVHTSTGR